jgi:hypothetical protein
MPTGFGRIRSHGGGPVPSHRADLPTEQGPGYGGAGRRARRRKVEPRVVLACVIVAHGVGKRSQGGDRGGGGRPHPRSDRPRREALAGAAGPRRAIEPPSSWTRTLRFLGAARGEGFEPRPRLVGESARRGRRRARSASSSVDNLPGSEGAEVYAGPSRSQENRLPRPIARAVPPPVGSPSRGTLRSARTARCGGPFHGSHKPRFAYCLHLAGSGPERTEAPPANTLDGRSVDRQRDAP